jgi:hypothetical protein
LNRGCDEFPDQFGIILWTVAGRVRKGVANAESQGGYESLHDIRINHLEDKELRSVTVGVKSL